MHEDAHLEMEYEDRNGGLVSTSDDLEEIGYDDFYDYEYCDPDERDTHW